MSPAPLLNGPLALALALGLGQGLGCAITLLMSRYARRRRGRLAGLAPMQLVRWLEAAPSGWLIVDADDVVRLLNPRAERLLQVGGAALLHALPLQRVCDAPELAELVRDARRRGRLQRLEWQRPGEELELVALPGEAGWVALLLQSRRSLEAQLEQQERWVSDVAHELKTPLTALLLVGDSLSAQVNSGNAVLVERL